MQCKSLVGILILALVIAGTACGAYAEKRWVPIDGTPDPERPKATVISSDEKETVIRFDIPGFWMEEITEGGISYQKLSFPGYATTLDVGKPELPVISELVAIPARAGIQAHIIEHSETVLEDYQVYPFQKILKIGEKRVEFDLDHEFYNRKEMYPEIVEIGEPGIWRDLRVVNLRVAPLRYNPASGELSACASMTVKLTYSGHSEVNSKKEEPSFVSSHYNDIYSQTVLNYKELDIPVLAESVSGYDLLIISDDEHIDNIDPLVGWKRSIGYKVNVVPISSVGTTAAEVKNYIQSEYDNYQISYCLLVGDGPIEGDIPFHYIDSGDGDFPYSLLEGSDSYPDIGIGRFPVSKDNETEVDNMVAKTISFESNPASGDWLSKSLLVAHLENAPLGFQTTCEEIRQATSTESGFYYSYYPLEFATAYGADPANGGDGASNQDVIDNIHSGVRVMCYAGHGLEGEWAHWNIYDESFGPPHVEQLANGDMTPIVFSLSCLTAKPILKTAGFGAYFTRHEEGAVAFFGATVVTTSISMELGVLSYAGLFDRGVPTISDATNEAIVQFIVKYGSYGVETADDYLWYGDPTLSVTCQGNVAQSPELISPAWGEAFDSQIQVTLDWNDMGKIEGGEIENCYQVQLDDDPDFSSPIAEENSVVSEWTTPELNQSIHYWRVRCYVHPDYGPWSETRHFFVGMDVAACELISPADEARFSIDIRGINFSWQNTYNPGEYLLQIDEDTDFNSPAEYTVSNTSYFVTILHLIDYSRYSWRVRATNPGWPWSEVRHFRFMDNNKPDPDPQESLTVNFPNPFNPSTEIRFGLHRAGHVRLDIFNVLGQKVCTLVDDRLEAGHHTITWNAGNVASGVYMYRLSTEEGIIAKKMLLIR